MAQEFTDRVSEFPRGRAAGQHTHRASWRTAQVTFEMPDVDAFLLDPPRKRRVFRSWFALAFCTGVLLALGIVALMNF